MAQKELSGKAAIVTGGSSGIGRAVVLKLAGEGAKVTIADVDLNLATRVAEEAKGLGGSCITVRTDVSKSQDVSNMVAETIRQFGKVDILVNDAGVGAGAMVQDLTEEDWDRVIGINLKGTFLCCREVIKHMIEKKSGRIVNFASGQWFRPSPMSAPYAASKGGIVSFSKSLALEVGSYGINVNVVVPGFTDTPMTRRIFGEGDALESGAASLGLVPPRGQIAKPEDIADVVLFLTKPASRHVLGQTIHVNGGSLMW
jgi:NAD(P)-dependent dehydrogenase (short-subunit alcohol dehydrogenase family)